MRRVSIIFLLIVLGLSLTLNGCNNGSTEIDENGVKVQALIDEYALTISSVPGLPLEISVEDNKHIENLVIRITVESGELIQWEKESGEIKILGNTKDLNYDNTILYWQPIDKNRSIIEDKEIELQIDLLNKDTNKLVNSNNYIIVENEGLYSLLNDN